LRRAGFFFERIPIELVCPDVRYWHKADIGLRGINVSFGGKAGNIRK
jgi:hypothetical protein